MSDFQRPPVGQRQPSNKPPFGTQRSQLKRQYGPKPIGRPVVNPSGRCMCGCGAETGIIKTHNWRRASYAGQRACFLPGHVNRLTPEQRADHAAYIESVKVKSWDRAKTGRGPVTKTCVVCGRAFEVTRSRAMARKYCSRRCYYKNPPRRGKSATTAPNYREFRSGQTSCQRPGCNEIAPLLQEHHVVYAQHVRRAGGNEWDARNALALCPNCHAAHHRKIRPLPVAALRDSNIDFAFDLFGPAAKDYFERYYSGIDPRIDKMFKQLTKA